jgi:hypothetical protein
LLYLWCSLIGLAWNWWEERNKKYKEGKTKKQKNKKTKKQKRKLCNMDKIKVIDREYA